MGTGPGTEFRQVNGTRIECRWIAGTTDSKPTLIFLHEGLGSVAMWKDFPDRVCKATGLPGLVYSRPGYGWSDPAPLPRTVNFMHDEALEILPALIDSCEIDQTILIGHSDGGSIALIHAAANKAVSALILLAPHVFIEEKSLLKTIELKSAYKNAGISERLRRFHKDVDHTFNGWVDIILNPGFRDWNIEKLLADIKVPVLHIQGKNDEFWTEAQPAAIKSQLSGPVEIVMLDNCGHSPHRDQPERVIEAIRDFRNRYLGSVSV